MNRPGGIGPVDTGRRVPLRIVADTDCADAAPGDAMVLDGPAGGVSGYAFRCPGCGCESALLLPHEGRGATPVWSVVAGDPRTGAGLTLSPSVHHAAPQGCGWHGWLRDGVLTPC